MPPRAYVFLAAQTQVNMGSRQNRVESNKVLPYFSIYQRTSIPKTEARSLVNIPKWDLKGERNQ